ncbi:unnamed protein product [Heterobilharzia americana]|nr:unnamed protein product [Heterobilharzia americana]
MEPTASVNSSKSTSSLPTLSCAIPESSSSSETSSDSESEIIIETPVIQKPKGPVFSVPPNYVLKSVVDLTPNIKVSALGKISHVFDNCVIVRSLSSSVALDERSVLFLEDGRHLGEVYEIFGPVRTPFYLVILSKSFSVPDPKLSEQITCSDCFTLTKSAGSSEDVIKEDEEVESTQTQVEIMSVTHTTDLDVLHSEIDKDVNESEGCQTTSSSVNDVAGHYEEKKKANQSLKEVFVFYAPDMPELTIPVFYNQLIANNNKGSDASWVGDMEPPPEALDFSDDEQEKLHKRKFKKKRKVPTPGPKNPVQKPSNQSNKPDSLRGKSLFGPMKRQASSLGPQRVYQSHEFPSHHQQSQQHHNFRPYMQPQSSSQWNIYHNMQPQWQIPMYGTSAWPSVPMYPSTVQNPYPYIPPQQYPYPYNMPVETHQNNPWSPHAPS